MSCHVVPGTPLHQAAAKGHLEEVDRLLEAGAPVDGRDDAGYTPLCSAARAGQTGTVRMLLARGASPAARCARNAWLPVQMALHTDRTETAMALLEDAVPLGKHDGLQVLAMAVGYSQVEVVERLLARRADPRGHLGGGPSMLGLAVGGAWDIDYRYRGCGPHLATARALLNAAPDLRLRAKTPPTTLGQWVGNFWDGRAIAYARKLGCEELVALVAAERHR